MDVPKKQQMFEKQPVSIESIIQQRKAEGLLPHDGRIHLKVANAREKLMYAMVDCLGERTKWLPQYDEVADWLSDNHGLGLMLMGSPGMGKTVVIHRVLPPLIERWARKVVKCYEALDLNDTDTDNRGREVSRYKHIVQSRLIAIDDVGTEPVAQEYGEYHDYFSELVDKCERGNKLLLCSTNLSVDEMKERYGLRTIDRLAALTRIIYFTGESFRRM